MNKEEKAFAMARGTGKNTQAMLDLLFAKEEPTEEEIRATIKSLTEDEVIAWRKVLEMFDI